MDSVAPSQYLEAMPQSLSSGLCGPSLRFSWSHSQHLANTGHTLLFESECSPAHHTSIRPYWIGLRIKSNTKAWRTLGADVPMRSSFIPGARQQTATPARLYPFYMAQNTELDLLGSVQQQQRGTRNGAVEAPVRGRKKSISCCIHFCQRLAWSSF